MTAQQTPVPWSLKKTGFDKYRISDTEGYEFCEVQNDDYERLEADARLIAATPEMRALLLQIHTELSHAASADADPANWEGYTLHRIEKLLWPKENK